MQTRVKTVSVEYKRKFNLGDYNSAEIGCTIWADVTDLQPETTLNDVMQGLWEMAKTNVKSNAVPEKGGATTTKQYFLGLPIELQVTGEIKPDDQKKEG